MGKKPPTGFLETRKGIPNVAYLRGKEFKVMSQLNPT
jgi:hypothetical protein